MHESCTSKHLEVTRLRKTALVYTEPYHNLYRKDTGHKAIFGALKNNVNPWKCILCSHLTALQAAGSQFPVCTCVFTLSKSLEKELGKLSVFVYCSGAYAVRADCLD